jgi:hypothetical protein
VGDLMQVGCPGPPGHAAASARPFLST